MDPWLQAFEDLPTWTLFGLVLVLTMCEWLAPRKAESPLLATRWTSNVGLVVLNSYLLRWLAPVAGIAWAAVCQSRGWGLLHWWDTPALLAIVIGVLAIDLVHYLRHLLLHRNAWLWRIHVTHHSDLDFDFTTGLRFHPFDALMSTGALLATVTLLGVAPLAVLLAEVLETASVLFEHANIRIPRRLDKVLRLVFVTPDMHRIHHSRAEGDTGSNLSTTFSFWDRMFGTYREVSSSGRSDLVIGLDEFDDPRHVRLPWMLVQPFMTDEMPGAPRQRRRPQMPVID
jgi:sterol desaturase/sphingolipid hydroxylase (fatty acid hydroxylase superfamily)